jgi:hypothetical protein
MYLTQDARVGTRTFRFYGVQNVHNHTKSVEFSKAIKDLIAVSFPGTTPELGHFAKEQSSAPSGVDVVQLYWRNGAWTNR